MAACEAIIQGVRNIDMRQSKVDEKCGTWRKLNLVLSDLELLSYIFTAIDGTESSIGWMGACI
jgi:hypothetical protein